MLNDDLLIVPPDRATGCLPRVSRPGEWCSLAAEAIGVIPVEEWAGLIPDAPNLRQRVNKIKDQDGVGSCATESTTQATEITRDMSGQPWVELNPWFIYHTSSGGRDSGSSVDANLRFVREKGIAPESVWPRSKGWRAKPSAEAYEAALSYRIEEFYDIQNTTEIGSALLKGFPVVFGWSGHSCVLTRLLTPTQAEYANSWGNWGDQGFGKINLRSINFGYGAWALRVPQMSAPALV